MKTNKNSRERIRQNKRLLNVAKALRESPDPKNFTMHSYFDVCGTPMCAFGHYAARRDLQKSFRNDPTGRWCPVDAAGNNVEAGIIDDYSIKTHFGLNVDEQFMMFSATGCNNAKSNISAAEFIEKFVKNRQ